MHVRLVMSCFPGYVLPTSTLQPGRPDLSRLFIRRMTCRPPSNETVIVRTRVSLSRGVKAGLDWQCLFLESRQLRLSLSSCPGLGNRHPASFRLIAGVNLASDSPIRYSEKNDGVQRRAYRWCSPLRKNDSSSLTALCSCASASVGRRSEREGPLGPIRASLDL